MLIKCPECDLQISDKAINCPHCGFPMKPDLQNIKSKKLNRRRRLPNGFGQITELKNMNLRKPFRAMVTVAKADEGRPVCKLLQPEAYFKPYNDAYQALLEYNKNPFNIQNSITIGELYEKWSRKFFAEASESVVTATRSAWRWCKDVECLRVSEFRPRHIRYCMEEATAVRNGISKTATPQMKERIKITFNKMLDYAVAYELIDKNYSRSFSISTITNIESDQDVKHHIPYTDEEISILWDNLYKYQGVDVMLIQCYTGWRPKELELMKLADVDLEEGIMTGGVKTKAGKDRIVPIHSKIRRLIEKRYRESESLNSEYLFTSKTIYQTGKEVLHNYRYREYLADVNNIKERLGLNPEHSPHDGRAHFITQAKKYGMNEFAIKYIVGHAITDITESV